MRQRILTVDEVITMVKLCGGWDPVFKLYGLDVQHTPDEMTDAANRMLDVSISSKSGVGYRILATIFVNYVTKMDGQSDGEL